MTHRCTNAVAKTRAHQVRWTSRCREPERRRRGACRRGPAGTAGTGTGSAEAGAASGGTAPPVERLGRELRRAAPDIRRYRFAERRKPPGLPKQQQQQHQLR